jgi:hypothetical protein
MIPVKSSYITETCEIDTKIESIALSWIHRVVHLYKINTMEGHHLFWVYSFSVTHSVVPVIKKIDQISLRFKMSESLPIFVHHPHSR